jgi:hypothetical protein
MMCLKFNAQSIDSVRQSSMFMCNSGQQDFTYSPLDTPATASGGVIHF